MKLHIPLILLYFFSLPLKLQAQCTAGCADDNLSNLAATAIDVDLIADDGDEFDLGSATFNWRNLYLGTAAYFAQQTSTPILFYNSNWLLHTIGGNNQSLYLGENAGRNANSAAGANNGCVAYGYFALNTLGTGYPSGTSNLGIGNHNTAIGWLSMRNANGSSMPLNQAADKNTMVGSRSGQRISAGRENTGLGYNIFYQGQAAESSAYITGTGNTGVGGAVNVVVDMVTVSHGVLGLLENGNYNTVMGYGSGIYIDEGSNNLILGDNAGSSATTGIGITSGSNNILIGSGTNVQSATADNQLNIGNLLYGHRTNLELSIGNSNISTLPSMFNVGSSNQFQVSNTGKFPQYGGLTPANGQLLIGDGTDMELATLTEGSAMDITNDAASITIDLDINELPAETDADVSADFFPVYDASEPANNKITLETMLAEYVTEYRKQRFDYYNEFINGVSNSTGGNDIVSVNEDGGGSIVAAPTTATNVVGIVRSSTGNTEATGRTSCSSGSSAVALGGGTWTYELRITGLAALSTATEEYQIVVGFFDVNSSFDQTDGVYFLYNRLSSVQWQAVASSNGTETYGAASGINVSTSAVTLKIVIDAGANSAFFFINGTQVTSITSGIPSGTNRAMGFGWLLIKDEGTANRTMDVDYISVQCDYSTAKN